MRVVGESQVAEMKVDGHVYAGSAVVLVDFETVRPARINEQSIGIVVERSPSSGRVKVVTKTWFDWVAMFDKIMPEQRRRKPRRKKPPNRAQRRKIRREADYLARAMDEAFE